MVTKFKKFTSGVQKPFRCVNSDASNITFEDVFTSSSVDNVYLLDKDSKRVLLSRTGEICANNCQLASLEEDDFAVVDNTGILILAENKLYLLKE